MTPTDPLRAPGTDADYPAPRRRSGLLAAALFLALAALLAVAVLTGGHQ